MTTETQTSISASIPTSATAFTSKILKSGKNVICDSTVTDNVNYISIGIKRFKELSLPVLSLLNSLNPSQRRMALLAVGIIFFWPLLILALNLPWMMAVGCVTYAFYFGNNKFYCDANEAVKYHLAVDVEEKGRQVQIKFQQSNFYGKETLIDLVHRFNEFSIVAYKSILLASMTVLDCLVTLLLNLARSAKNYASAANETKKE